MILLKIANFSYADDAHALSSPRKLEDRRIEWKKSQSLKAYVFRFVFVMLLCIATFLITAIQTPSWAQVTPFVNISLPLEIPSETVQISCQLSGPFGGYRTYTEPRADRHSYTISALVGGKVATEIRMIVYAPGCEIQTFVIPLAEDSRIEQKFGCQHVASVQLSGQIVPNELVRDKNAELVVTYMAYWGHRFFGIADGAVTEFQLVTVVPDANGMFRVNLPYFSADVAASSPRRASLNLTLPNSRTLNVIALNLEPNVPELMLEEHTLRIRSSYPAGIKFSDR